MKKSKKADSSIGLGKDKKGGKSKGNSSSGSSKKGLDDSQISVKGKIKSGGELVGTHEGVFSEFHVTKMCSFGEELWVGGPAKIAIFNVRKVSFVHEIAFKVAEDDEITSLRFVTLDSLKFVWCGFKTGRIIVFDANKRRIFSEIAAAHKMEVTEICQVSKRVWTCSLDCTIRIWDLKTQKPLEELIDHNKSVRALTFVKETGTVWTGGEEQLIKLRDFETGKVKNTITGFIQGICQMKNSSGTVWITGNKGSVFIFDSVKTMCLKEIRAYKCSTYALECTTEEVWTLGQDRVMKVFSIKFQRTVKNIFGTNKEIWVTALVPVGFNQVWAHCSDGLIRVWSTLGEKIDDNGKIKSTHGSSGSSGGGGKKKRKGKKKKRKALNQTMQPKKNSSVKKTISGSKKRLNKSFSVGNSNKKDSSNGYSQVQAKINNNNTNTEYQKELIKLRKQLEGATERIGKYKNRLKKRQKLSSEQDSIIDDITKKYNETNQSLVTIKESGIKNSQEIDDLKMKIQKLKEEKEKFLMEMTNDLNLPKSNNFSEISEEIKKNFRKSQDLKMELKSSKDDLLEHIKNLKQIHLNFVKMQSDLTEKEKLISSLNKLIVETSGENGNEKKVQVIVDSLKEKSIEMEKEKSKIKMLEEENNSLKNEKKSILVKLKSMASNFEIEHSDEENLFFYLNEIDKKAIDFKASQKQDEIKELLKNLKDHLEK